MRSKIGSVSSKVCLVVVAVLFASPTFAKRGGPGPGIPLMAPLITAEQAIEVVKAVLPKLAVGKFWVWTGPRGDTKAKVALILGGKVVSRVELNPVTGEILAKGQDIFVNQVAADPNQALNRVREMFPT